jgi:nitrite reductase/ring-hydroxylating ferredoxin subunit
MPSVVVGRVETIPPGTQTQVVAGRRTIAIFNADGTFYALRDVCPHQGACLSDGVVVSHLAASGPGQYEFDSDRKMVRCPRHGWEYDLATGQSWYNPATNRVRAYKVAIRSGSDLRQSETRDAGLAPGPYRAEVIPITVEDEYVVVEV